MNKTKSREIKIALATLLFVASFPLAIVRAQDDGTPTSPATPATTAAPAVLPDSFANFGIASALTPDKQVIGKTLAHKKAFVYKMTVAAAQQMRIFAQGHSSSAQGQLTLSLYTATGALLSRSAELVAGDKALQVFYYKGFLEQGQASEDIYVEFENTSTDAAATVTYDFVPSIVPLADVVQGADASDGVAHATELAAGTYKANHLGKNACGVNQYCSTDATDTYAVLVKAGQEATLTVTPVGALGLSVSFVDASGAALKQGVVSATAPTPVVYQPQVDGTLYVVITGNPAAVSPDYFGSYDMTLALSAASTTPPTTNPPVTPPTTSTGGLSLNSLMQFAKDNMLVVAGIGGGVLVLVVVLILFVRRRGKRKKMKAAVASAAQSAGQGMRPTVPASGAGDPGQIQGFYRPPSPQQQAAAPQPQNRRVMAPMTRTPEAPRDPNAEIQLDPADFGLGDDGSQPQQ